jgi:hypothetical protein
MADEIGLLFGAKSGSQRLGKGGRLVVISEDYRGAESIFLVRTSRVGETTERGRQLPAVIRPTGQHQQGCGIQGRGDGLLAVRGARLRGFGEKIRCLAQAIWASIAERPKRRKLQSQEIWRRGSPPIDANKYK